MMDGDDSSRKRNRPSDGWRRLVEKEQVMDGDSRERGRDQVMDGDDSSRERNRRSDGWRRLVEKAEQTK